MATQIKLINNDTQNLAYKIKSTNPAKYSVKPS